MIVLRFWKFLTCTNEDKVAGLMDIVVEFIPILLQVPSVVITDQRGHKPQKCSGFW